MKWISLSLLASALLISSSALAQDDAGYQTKDVQDGYQVVFRDDPLGAGGMDPASGTIQVRRGPLRQTLIRPRVAFVAEMLESVENL